MMQNARQIQKLVNETFPSNSFESRASLADCMDADSDGEALNCMWVNIMKTVNSREHYSSESFLDLLITVS